MVATLFGQGFLDFQARLLQHLGGVIHPKDLPQTLEGEAAVNMFAGFGSEQQPDARDPYYAMTA